MSRFTGNTSGLMVLCSVQFVVVLDATIVTTALPAIRSSLGFNDAGLTWVVTAYTLVFGALLVPAGRVADLLGPRRALVTGLGIFVAASATCATAWTPAALVAARAVQGLGAALLAPAALALLGLVGGTASAGGRADRAGRAVGLWTAAGAVGGGSGWVIGGLFTGYLGWPAIFWINLPIGLVAIAPPCGCCPADSGNPAAASTCAAPSPSPPPSASWSTCRGLRSRPRPRSSHCSSGTSAGTRTR